MSGLATKFLDHYTLRDRDIFFGRDKEISVFTQMVNKSKLTLLYGLSGTGKTSLIECGVANEISEFDWFDLYVRRRFNFVDSLREAIIQKSRSIITSSVDIVSALQILYEDYFKPVYLVFDQLEELFISGTREEINEFGDLLSAILQANVKCRVILVIREEYFGRLDIFEKKIPSIYDSRMRLERMSTSQLTDVVDKIAVQSEVEIENEKVTDRILAAVSDGSGAVDLPYLIVYLEKIYGKALDKKAHTGDKIVFDERLISESQFGDVLGDYLNDTVEKIAKEMEAGVGHGTRDWKIYIWGILKKYFISNDGTKRTFSLNDFHG